MTMVVMGRLNKQIAYELGISESTVKADRSQVMRKLNAAAPPDLAQMADKLNLTEESPRVVRSVDEFGLPLNVYPAVDFPLQCRRILAGTQRGSSSIPKLECNTNDFQTTSTLLQVQ